MADSKILARLAELRRAPERAISMGEKYMRSTIPDGWTTYEPSIKVEARANGDHALVMDRADLESAASRLQASGGVIRRRYGLSSQEYVYWDRHAGGKDIVSEPYPVRVEAMGAPDGSKDPGAGRNLWGSTADLVSQTLRAEVAKPL